MCDFDILFVIAWIMCWTNSPVTGDLGHYDLYVIPLWLTLEHRETHGCVVSTVATDALVLKHQAITIHNAD